MHHHTAIRGMGTASESVQHIAKLLYNISPGHLHAHVRMSNALTTLQHNFAFKPEIQGAWCTLR